MKRTLFLLLLITSETIFAEELNQDDSIAYFSILERFGAISSVGGDAPLHTTAVTVFSLELMIPLNRNHFHLYSQFRTTLPLSYLERPLSDLRPIINMENIRIGGLLGFGGYVYDNRKFTGRGVSISINGGVVVEAGIANLNSTSEVGIDTGKSPEHSFLNVGFEINMRMLYSIIPHISLVLGTDIGYLYAIGSGDPFYASLHQAIVSYDTITYGLTLGLSF